MLRALLQSGFRSGQLSLASGHPMIVRWWYEDTSNRPPDDNSRCEPSGTTSRPAAKLTPASSDYQPRSHWPTHLLRLYRLWTAYRGRARVASVARSGWDPRLGRASSPAGGDVQLMKKYGYFPASEEHDQVLDSS